MKFPFPMNETPQAPVYHAQDAPAPRVPPVMLMIVEEPGQTDCGNPYAPEGDEELLFTKISTLRHPVVLQEPSALTK